MDKTLKDFIDLINAHNRNVRRLQEQVADLNRILAEIEAAMTSKDEAVEEIVFESTNGGEQEFVLQCSPVAKVTIKVDGTATKPASVNAETGVISLAQPLAAGVQVTAKYMAIGRATALKQLLQTRPMLPPEIFGRMRIFWIKVRDQQGVWLGKVSKL